MDFTQVDDAFKVNEFMKKLQTKEFMQQIITFDRDHWSQVSAARTILGFMRTVNTFIEDTVGSIDLEFTNSNLNIIMNCHDEIAKSIPKDQLEFSFGQNLVDSMVDYDFSFDLSKDLEEFMNDSPSIREGMEKAGLKNPTGVISLL